MKKLCIIFLAISNLCYTQNWTWIKGSSTTGPLGVYGTIGVPAMANTPCGRHGCAKWVDLNGNLWLFGGEGPSNSWRNDLWKYTIATNEWTWIRGSTTAPATGVYGTLGTASSSNDPPGREFAACWTDAAGNFWMFGGDGYDPNNNWGHFGDLWKYNPLTNQWTWMEGYNTINQIGVYGTQGSPSPSNMPGCRSQSGVWTDAAGDFFMFGGTGFGSGTLQGLLNDLWKYNVASNQWTWVSGTNTTNQVSIYGTLSVPLNTNNPGGRYFPACWYDASGNTYLFGGYGYAATNTNSGYLNDMWKYDPVTNAWAWIGGPTVINSPGIYGTQGVSNAANIPGSRQSPAYWKDVSGNLWLFGGGGFSSVNALGIVNDLFRYNPGINEWTWMKGSNLQNQNGSYGTIGVPALSNTPGAKEYNTWWKDLTGKFWLFGGEGYDMSNTATGHMNDLWTYSVPCSADSIIATPGKIICSGTSLTFSAVNGGPSTIWYPSATSTSSISGGSTLSVSSLTTAPSQTVYSYFAESNYCTAGPRASISITVNPLPTLTIMASSTITCKHQPPLTFTVGGATSYNWNLTPPQTTSIISVQPSNSTTYVVTGTDLNGCTNSATIAIKVVSDCPNGIEIISNTTGHSLYPNPNQGVFVLKIESVFQEAQLYLFNTLGQRVFKQKLDASETLIKPELSKGVYFYQLIINGNKNISGKLVIE